MQLKTASWQKLQRGYAGTIRFSSEQFLTFLLEKTWIQEWEDGQEGVSAHGIYKNIDPNNINTIPLIY